MSDHLLGRRQILMGASVAAVAATTAACSPNAAGSGAGDTGKWDHECDVLCVGSGAAAGTAAVTAFNEGAKVILAEKMPILGGTTGKSGGVTWIFNHFILQKEGIKDEKADALRYAARYGYPRDYDVGDKFLGIGELKYKLIEAFYDHGAAAVDYLRDLGAVQFKEFRLFQVDQPAPDYADHLPENKTPTRRSLEPAVGSGSAAGGGSLAAQLEKHLRDKKVPIMTDTRVTRLVMNEGRVIGAEAESGGKTIRIKANKGVIFGTGGYSHNEELCNLHQPSLYGSCSNQGSTGDFLEIAQEAGAKMGDLSMAWRTQVLWEEALANRALGAGAFVLPGDSMILVNKFGKRCVNEKRDYNDRTKAHFSFNPTTEDYPNHLMFMLFDERSIDAFGGAFPFPLKKAEQPWLIEGASWDAVFAGIAERLAKHPGKTGGTKLAPDFAASARASIASFNGYAVAGKDPEFDRGVHLYDRQWHLLFSAKRQGTAQPDNPHPNPTMHPIADEGPFYAFILAPGSLDTSGGPLVNENAQVLGRGNAPIPGLYGAGNCIHAPTGNAYLGAGGTIGPALTFGHIAGKHAANA